MTARWKEHTLSVKPSRVYEYFVTGHGTFPFDMLRYDCAWPADSEAAFLMECHPGHESFRKNRSIKLRSYREPTVDRWASFMWSVGVHKLTEGV